MKKSFILILYVILSISVVSCGKENEQNDTTASFYASVIGMKDDRLYLTPVQNDIVTEKLVSIPWDREKYASRGRILYIEYDGTIVKSYPASGLTPITVEFHEEDDIRIDSGKFREAYEDYVHLLINPDYPYGEKALNEFVQNIADGTPAKYSYYIIGEEGDPVFLYYEYVMDDVIGNYIVEGFDTTYDNWNAQPGITYYNFPYIFENEYGDICVSECINTDAYNSVINFSSGETSYVYFNTLGKGALANNLKYDNAIPVLRINASATATLGIDPINNPNVIILNYKGSKTILELKDTGDYLARGVYFKTDDDFVVVCENMTETTETTDYLAKEYSIMNGVVVEEKAYYSEKMPSV